MSNQPENIIIGVSSCLLGQKVRYDGGHKRNSFVLEELSQYFTFRDFCPEVNAGMSIPRQPIHLIDNGNGIHCVDVQDERIDYTQQLAEDARQQYHWQQELSGYILKKDSPSCGMERVKIYRKGHPHRDGTGIYAKELLTAFPHLPIEEEGRLNDPALRENFINRVFIYHRWKQITAAGLTLHKWMQFHAQHKWIFFSHHQKQARELGKLLANTCEKNFGENSALYLANMMALLKSPPTRKNHSNVLQHIQGFLKNHLSSDEKSELSQVIHDYREGLLPLIVPITLLRHHFLNHPHDYMQQSYYLDPHPKDLKLLNSV